jgi:hypothetical protein
MIGFDMREGMTKWEHWQHSVREKIGSFKLQHNPRTFWFSIHSYFLHHTWESLLASQRTNLLLRLSIASRKHKVLRLGPSTVSTSRKRGDYDNQILVIINNQKTTNTQTVYYFLGQERNTQFVLHFTFKNCSLVMRHSHHLTCRGEDWSELVLNKQEPKASKGQQKETTRAPEGNCFCRTGSGWLFPFTLRQRVRTDYIDQMSHTFLCQDI